MKMKIVLDEGAYMPEKAHRADAGYDLRTPKRVVLRRHESVSIDTGSIVAKLYNLSDEDYVFDPGDKIVQIVFMPCGKLIMNQVDELDDTDRGDEGFGSTGR